MAASSSRRTLVSLRSSILVVLPAVLLAVSGCSRSAEEPSDSAKDASTATEAAPTTQPGTASTTGQPLIAEEGTDVLTFKVVGMHCSGCATAIAGELTKMGGIRQARVSFPKGTAWVMVDKDGAATPDQIMETIQRVGYKSEPVPAAQTH